MSIKSEKVIEYRKRRKQNLIKVCGNKCCLCGYNKIPNALEFHHIKSEEKLYGIAENGNCHDLEKDISEIKKCVLVCSNCHREIHYGLYDEEELIQHQFFDEEMIEKLREEKNKKEYFCINCGKELSEKTKSGLCADCYHKTTRIVSRPNREELKNFIQNYSFSELGKIFGVSDNAIRKWCIAENLPSKKSDIKKVQDWEKI